jgi:hypothetical protein
MYNRIYGIGLVPPGLQIKPSEPEEMLLKRDGHIRIIEGNKIEWVAQDTSPARNTTNRALPYIKNEYPPPSPFASHHQGYGSDPRNEPRHSPLALEYQPSRGTSNPHSDSNVLTMTRGEFNLKIENAIKLGRQLQKNETELINQLQNHPPYHE